MKRMGNLMLPIHGICLSHAIHLAVCDTLYEKHSHSEDVQSEVDVAYDNESDEDLEMNDPVDVVDQSDSEIVLKEEVEKAVEKVRKIVQKIRKSAVKSDFLRAKCEESGEKFTSLILDCQTRWNSLADMLGRYIKLQDVVKCVLEEYDYPQQQQLTRRERDIVKQVSDGLHVIKIAASYLSNRNMNLLAADTVMTETIGALIDQNTDFTTQLAESLQTRYDQRKLSKPLELLYYLSGCKSRVESSDLILQRYATTLLTRLFGPSIECSSTNQIEADRRDRSEDHECEIVEDLTGISFAEKLSKKLSEASYIQSAPKQHTPCSEEFKVFIKTEEKSENLKKLETALNTIQVSSVESERAFSAAGLFLTKLRCRMADATLDRRCFLKAYFQNKKKLDGK